MKIYRYRAISTYTYDEIISGEVWHSKFSELNDPFEGFYMNNSNDDALDSLIHSFALGCFSRVKDSLLMWAHYGDSHRGLCLEYEVTDNDFRTTFMEVHYSDTVPKIDAIERYPADHHLAGALKIDIQKEGMVFTTKSKHWDYEEEVRSLRILEDPALKGEKSKFPGQITSILFGLRTTERQITTIDKILCQRPELEFYRARLKEDSYEIEFERVDRASV